MHGSWLNSNTYLNLGPVVQSIVSLTESLVNDSLSLLVRLKSSVLIFFAEKCEELLHCKSSSHFFGKKWQCFYVWYVWNFNVTLTNDVVSFEQLGPVLQLGPLLWYFSRKGYPSSEALILSKVRRAQLLSNLPRWELHVCCQGHKGPGTSKESSLVFTWWAKGFWENFLSSYMYLA